MRLTDQQSELRKMTPAQQREWMLSNYRPIRAIDLFTVKLNGVLVACGRSGEEDEMFATFTAAVNGPPIARRRGGMG